MYRRAIDGMFIFLEERYSIDFRLGFYMVARILMIIVLAIAFLTWLYRVRLNELALGVTDGGVSVGYSIWVWFIPIVQLFRPYQILKEVWWASGEFAGVDGSQDSPVWTLLNWWWGLWIAGTLVCNLLSNVMKSVSAGDLSERLTVHIAADYVQILSSVLLMGSALMAVALVREITRRQDMRHGSRPEVSEN